MKKSKLLFLLPLAAWLFACGPSELPSQSQSEEESESSQNSESSLSESSSESEETTSSSEESEETKTESSSEIEELEPFSISRDDIPPSEQSSYLSQDITIGEHTFYVENVQQGNGEYNGTIQMRKENSFIYNKTPLGHSQITITLLDTREEPYNPIMAELTVYYGEAENPSEMEAEVAKEEKGDGTVVCTYKLPSLRGYVKIANESSRAGYALSIEFGTDK